MQRVPVDSSDIISIGYDADARLLEIEFHGGRLYAYRNVDTDIYEQLMRADSHGQYFNTFIHGKYRFERIDAEVQAPTRGPLVVVSSDAYAFANLEMALQSFAIEVERQSLPIDEVVSDEIESMAIKKAKAAFRLVNRPVVVMADAWNILSLHGFPGTMMRPIAGQLTAADYTRLLADASDRTISITQMVVYYDGRRSKVCQQTLFGAIGTDTVGTGYGSIDQLVMLTGYTKTMAKLYDDTDTSVAVRQESVWQDFAKWYNLQRRIGRA
jgi:inosine/xanthosine triphosphate pyrophosphatase family protein